MDEIERRRRVQALGQRALDYYVDTGLCVFCNADDCTNTPHEDCDVGEILCIALTPERVERKRREREVVDAAIEASLLADAELQKE